MQLDESVYLMENNIGNTCLHYSGTERTCSDAEKEDIQEYRIPEGKYFLIGDNRAQSLDSRQCFDSIGSCRSYREAQFVPRSQIQGRVLLSLGHFDVVDSVIPLELGDLSWVIKPRWTNIPQSHDYGELR